MKKIKAFMDELNKEYVMIDGEKFYLDKTGEPTAKEFYYEMSIAEDEHNKRIGISSPGKMISFGRKQLNITQEELSKKLGIKQNTLSRYENNTRQVPFETFEKAMNILGFKFKIEKK